jgi:hypothetical protein
MGLRASTTGSAPFRRSAPGVMCQFAAKREVLVQGMDVRPDHGHLFNICLLGLCPPWCCAKVNRYNGAVPLAGKKITELPLSMTIKGGMKNPDHQRTLLAVAALVALLAPMGAAPASAAGNGIFLAPHRAIYEMTLATTRGGSGVTSVAGRMVYELTGSVCEGYTQNMRFVTSMVNQNGSTVVTDLRSSSWEEGNAKRFRFNSSQFRDEKATEVTSGDAARPNTAGDVKVELTKPAKKDLSLRSGVYFPIQHSIALIDAARAGKTSFRADLFDGSEKGEKVYDTVSAIGRPLASDGNAKLRAVKNSDRLDHLAAWPVSIGYFEPGSDRSDAVPVYELSFLFFENGVSRKLLIDYGEFAIQGELKEISFTEPGKCEPPQR